jgi:hypothetical protein
MTRGHEAVAAIIAGPAQNGDGAGIGKAPGEIVGHGTPSILHQSEAGNATLYGDAVGLTHLFRGQKFQHKSPPIRVCLFPGTTKAASRAQVTMGLFQSA